MKLANYLMFLVVLFGAFAGTFLIASGKVGQSTIAVVGVLLIIAGIAVANRDSLRKIRGRERGDLIFIAKLWFLGFCLSLAVFSPAIANDGIVPVIIISAIIGALFALGLTAGWADPENLI